MMDIRPAAHRMTALLEHVSEDQFDRPTPCPDASLGDLIDHIGTFARAFGSVARKDNTGTGAPPPAKAANLESGWCARIARDLGALADAWDEPAAWTGMTAAGGIDLPGEIAGLVALDELVVHGWDIAVASGQGYLAPEAEIAGAMAFLSGFDVPRDGRLFGPIVPVADDASPFEKLLGLTGRDPAWRAV